jgi:transcription initiation factor TFIIF subunit beta
MDGQQASVKQESNSFEEPPSVQSDEDLYEDTGDLDFTASTQSLILTRIPKFLWESWSQLGDDEEIQLGTIRFEGGPDDVKRVSIPLLFNPI